uniref:WGS project CBMI000000000 data, contig CS3069_c003371 n=1 Tax=Fusarium clavum TaxID=2594811 RepID=A0A090MHX5_9HYPO|nr:unnamed protein product [Fusarium clavum]
MKGNRPDKKAFLTGWDMANRNVPRPRVRDVFLVNDSDLDRTHRGQRFKQYCFRHGAAGMFGKGIYVSDCSLKANYFALNENNQTDLHIMLLVRTAPDPGFDSVEAVLWPAGSVGLPESIVYREDAIVPIGAITYCIGNDTDDRLVPSVGPGSGPSRILSPSRPPNPGPNRPPNPGNHTIID